MYEITIKKLERKELPPEQIYQKIADTGGDDEDKSGGGVKYGYVTKPSVEKLEWTVKFQQQTETVDIIATIAAFNGVTFNK